MASGNNSHIKDAEKCRPFLRKHVIPNLLLPQTGKLQQHWSYSAIPRIQAGHLLHGKPGERVCFALFGSHLLRAVLGSLSDTTELAYPGTGLTSFSTKILLLFALQWQLWAQVLLVCSLSHIPGAKCARFSVSACAGLPWWVTKQKCNQLEAQTLMFSRPERKKNHLNTVTSHLEHLEQRQGSKDHLKFGSKRRS